MRTLFMRAAIATAATALLAAGTAALTAPANAATTNAATTNSAGPATRSTDAVLSPVPAGTYYIVNVGTGRCLDAFYDQGGGNGNQVGLWDCNGGISEKWNLSNNGSSGYFDLTILNARSGRSLDYPAESGGAKGWQFQLWDYVNSSGQRFWPFRNSTTGEYEISVEIGGGGLDMDAYASGGGLNGNPVGLWDITNSPLQHWVLVPA